MIPILVVMSGQAAEGAPKARTQMGAWDCNGSQPTDVDVPPGEHVYVRRGECSGAEGCSEVVEPRPDDLVIREAHDAKRKELQIKVVNRSRVSVRVKMREDARARRVRLSASAPTDA